MEQFFADDRQLMVTYERIPLPTHISAMRNAWDELAGKATFGGNLADRETALSAYRRRTEEVRHTLPAERVLVFNVAEGWKPLCRFLGVPVPDIPFPHHNLRADFWEVLGGEPS